MRKPKSVDDGWRKPLHYDSKKLFETSLKVTHFVPNLQLHFLLKQIMKENDVNCGFSTSKISRLQYSIPLAKMREVKLKI